MKQLERTIFAKESRIQALFREIEALQIEIETLKKANDIVGGRTHASVSIGDAVENILREYNRAIDVDELLMLLNEKGLSPKKKVMVSVLRNDTRQRFIEPEPQLFMLNENPMPTELLYANRNVKKVEGLSAGIRQAIYSIGSSDFTIADVMRKVETDNPALWEQIKDNTASVSPTLKRLALDGEIEIISKGKGATPNTYKAKSLAGESAAHAVSTESSNEVEKEAGE